MPKKPLKLTSDKINFAVGGQAIMEGVMMRSPNFYVMAVRRMTGEIIVESRKYISLVRRSKFWALPMLRGIAVLYESVMLGMKALMFSSNVLMEDIDNEEAPKKKRKKPKKKKENWFQKLSKGLFLVAYFAFLFAAVIFLFKYIPLLAAETSSKYFEVVEQNYWLFNLIDGFTKVVIFVGYILLISLLPDIRRVFGYHGAEHQAIWAYERGVPLTIKNAQKEHPEHPRCGTSFIILVLIISVLMYTILPAEESFVVKLAERVAILPIIAGLSYEVLKLSAKHEGKWWMHWVTVPGILLQKITTKKPDDEMEEVAIAALKGALAVEKDFKSENGGAIA